METMKQHTAAIQGFLDQSNVHFWLLQAQIINLGPRSLAHDRPLEVPVPGAEQSWLKRSLLHIGGYYTKESQLIRGSKVLYSDIVEQATNKDFYTGAAPCLDRCCAI